jgi:hypothetical protein
VRKKASVLDSPQFRALSGDEALPIIVDKIDLEFRKELTRCLSDSNNFFIGDSYPAVSVDGQIKVKILPNNLAPTPFFVNIHFILGTRVETAPDKLREDHGLKVLQPQKRPSGFIMNMEVEHAKENEQEGNEDKDGYRYNGEEGTAAI